MYRKEVGGDQKVLFVPEGETAWSIMASTSSNEATIKSGRATNPPSTHGAGPSVREQVSSWRYQDGVLKEGKINVHCIQE